jgi:hypothetical protein
VFVELCDQCLPSSSLDLFLRLCGYACVHAHQIHQDTAVSSFGTTYLQVEITRDRSSQQIHTFSLAGQYGEK